ncbi:CoA transferase [Dactylosporangium sp. NPDC000244]|uniref:CaiB/BaiF CoA transferase family protein n=1 Tax=Dactylosporangium sp. NPDC000244 TaxID=3154365 RepID=UPI003324071E
MVEGPLAGILVVDFTRLIAGPCATDLLAALGARVIKIESAGGDPMRLTRSAGTGSLSASPTFVAYNSLKESIVLDLKHGPDRELALNMCTRADVVIESFRPGVMDRLGLGSDAIRTRNPDVIYASLSAFGNVEPLASRGGVDIVLQAECGLMSVTGEAGRDPLKVGVPIVDSAAAYVVAFGVVSALLNRVRHGVCDDVVVSMFDVGLHAQAQAFSEFLTSGNQPPRTGNRVPYAAPAEVYPTAEGMLVLSAHIREHWPRLCSLLGRPDLVADPRFIDVQKRVDNRAALSEQLVAALAGRTAAEWVEILGRAGLTVGRIRSYEDVLGGPEVAAGQSVVAGVNADGAPVRLVRSPVRFRRWSDAGLARRVRALDADGPGLRQEFAVDLPDQAAT